MKIVKVEQVTCHRVTTNEKHYHEYTRYGPESWTVRMGESEEQVYECGEIEAAFQAATEETWLCEECYDGPGECKIVKKTWTRKN